MDGNPLWSKFYLDKIDDSWQVFFRQEAKRDCFFSLLQKLDEEYSQYRCWPARENIFRLFREISLPKVKVVILGQDPYHQSGVADGIAFSTQKRNYLPPSLKNIFEELSRDLSCEISPSQKADLLPWVKEGVFLLNTALTVRESKPLSHAGLWITFTYSLINFLHQQDQKLIWVFWGQKAKKIKEECQIADQYSLLSAHPSPYSAEYGFFHSSPFSRINQMLRSLVRREVDWLAILEPPAEK